MKPQSTYVIAYDIRDPRRLNRVHRRCKRAGLHLQYSVFLVRATIRQIDRLTDELEALIDPGEDDVRIYPVPHQPDWVALGRSLWPEDVQFFHPGMDFLQPNRGAPTVCRPEPSESDPLQNSACRDRSISSKGIGKRLNNKNKSTKADKPQT